MWGTRLCVEEKSNLWWLTLNEAAKLKRRTEKDQKIDSLIRADGRQLSGPVA